MTATQRAAALASLSDEAASALLTDWRSWARPEQLPPDGAWVVWLILAGRGCGKTRTGAEFVRARVDSGEAKRIALVGRTSADTRDVMLEGESGLLSIFPAHQRPVFSPSKRRVTFHTGAVATLYSADEPNLLRGPQHDTAWCDELAAWNYPDAWDQLILGLRLGDPRVVVTTTPRPIPIIRDLAKRDTTRVTRGSTYDNKRNLSPAFLREVAARYEGTRLGRQELFAELLEDTQGALWTRAQLDAALCREVPKQFRRIVVALDPSVAKDGGGDEAGIVVVGIDEAGLIWVLEDGSEQLAPEAWAKRACEFAAAWKADCLVAEANNGGSLVELVVRAAWDDPEQLPPRIKLVHAAQGKRARAEPVAALYEQHRVRHAPGLAKLEDEMCTWAAATSTASPNRIDALTWGVTELGLGPRVSETFFRGGRRR